MSSLYERLFATVCTDYYGHLDTGREAPSPVNAVCFMWWDEFPIHGQLEHADIGRMTAAILSVMERALGLRSVACRESALHGLGHWEMYTPEEVHRIIDDFLRSTPDLAPELLAYAERARLGRVL